MLALRSLDVPLHQPSQLYAWIFLHLIGGQILLPILLFTILFSKRLRGQWDPTIVNLIITWTLLSTISCLLFYADRHIGQHPSLKLCLTQATLVYGAPPMVAMSGLCVVIQIYVNLTNDFHSPYHVRGDHLVHARRWNQTVQTFFLVCVPYITFLVFFIASAATIPQHPRDVSRTGSFFYCTVRGKMNTVTASFSVLCTMLTVALELWVVYLYHRRLQLLECNFSPRVVGDYDPRYPLVPEPSMSTNMLIRIVMFSLYVCLAFGSYLIGTTPMAPALPWMLTAAVPLAAFLLLASQRSIMQIWFPCFSWPTQNDDRTVHRTNVPRLQRTPSSSSSSTASSDSFTLPPPRRARTRDRQQGEKDPSGPVPRLPTTSLTIPNIACRSPLSQQTKPSAKKKILQIPHFLISNPPPARSSKRRDYRRDQELNTSPTTDVFSSEMSLYSYEVVTLNSSPPPPRRRGTDSDISLCSLSSSAATRAAARYGTKFGCVKENEEGMNALELNEKNGASLGRAKRGWLKG